MGHAFAPNAERGVFRSTDGGKTWDQGLYVDDRTGATDLASPPANPNVVFAAMYQVQRQPWTITSGGPAAACTAPPTAAHLEASRRQWPAGWNAGRIGVSVSGGRSNRVYA
jgi:hypothetical protein